MLETSIDGKGFEPQEYHQVKAATIAGCIGQQRFAVPIEQQLTNPQADS